MERHAGLTRDLSNRKLRHDARVARQKAKRKGNREELWRLRRPDGKGVAVTDPTPYVCVLNRVTGGKYLEVGQGFIIRKRVKEIMRCPVDVTN